MRRKSKLILSILFAISIIVVIACAIDEESAFEKAEKLNKNSDYINALLAYNKVIMGNDDFLRSEAFYKKAMIQYLNLKNSNEALKIFEIYLKRYPTGTRADQILKNMGDIFFRGLVVDYNRAIYYYQNLIDNYPNSKFKEEAMMNLSKSYFSLENYSQAITEYSKILVDFPKSDKRAEIELEIASSYDLVNQDEKAISLYREIISKYTEKPSIVVIAKFNLASIYQELEKVNEALDLFESIKYTYPNPQVVKMKIDKINYRKNIQGRD